MDGKTVAIGVLVATALALGGLVTGGLRQDGVAYGQGGVYASYVTATAEVRDDNAQFIILDTARRRLIFYGYDVANKKLVTADGRKLIDDFRRAPSSM